MANSDIVNVTYRGMSRDLPDVELHSDASDDDVRRVAAEVLSSLGVMHPNGGALTESDFEHFVVDRFENQERIYLRPKVPFGSTEMPEHDHANPAYCGTMCPQRMWFASFTPAEHASLLKQGLTEAHKALDAARQARQKT